MRKLPLLFMVLLTFFSCREPDCPPGSEDQARLPESFTNFFYFKKGSYWVLQNEKNGRLDSIWVYKEPVFQANYNIRGNNPGSLCPGSTSFYGGFVSLDTSKLNYNRIAINIEGTKTKEYVEFGISTYKSNRPDNSLRTEEQDHFARQIFWKKEQIDNENKYDKTFMSKKAYTTFTHNLIVSGKRYDRIFQITPLALYDTLFFAEKVGIVKAYRLDTAYQLIRFHLN